MGDRARLCDGHDIELVTPLAAPKSAHAPRISHVPLVPSQVLLADLSDYAARSIRGSRTSAGAKGRQVRSPGLVRAIGRITLYPQHPSARVTVSAGTYSAPLLGPGRGLCAGASPSLARCLGPFGSIRGAPTASPRRSRRHRSPCGNPVDFRPSVAEIALARIDAAPLPPGRSPEGRLLTCGRPRTGGSERLVLSTGFDLAPREFSALAQIERTRH